MSEQRAAGVLGVGSMGKHHARVYDELPETRLVGVSDTDDQRAREVASGTTAAVMDSDDLLEAADVVSVAVPTRFHADAVQACIDRGVDVLVEKPFVDDHQRGREIAAAARAAGVTLQVGHIERFNPAVRVLDDIVPDLDVVAVDIDRLGPPTDRDSQDSVVKDLMIHDVDILLDLIDAEIETLTAVARDDQHATAQFQFDTDTVATLTASRRTQQKVRELVITAESCRVTVDFIDQHVEIHRRSVPEYVQHDGDVRYRHESVVERPTVTNGEPLKAQLEAFVAAARDGTEPPVTAEDALDALEIVDQIEALALGRVPEEVTA
ncbi:Gfo/Idh/MocA family protein [Halococcoides cellulosivorans]|uniref:Gfo/Idh/MocA family oxidoreductase n=1 Tax=Halococcoides cellulosivorans TaxID=1679096 RepID=A0A2R4X3E4_9EURY|nr:Gfo/Idh/MocA family oxidoreductase [Halococcoides cellulosivorans]AWB28317.1 gfo/Idh/MocA family oxidoreductase [Halococcoides cellulosivorans]